MYTKQFSMRMRKYSNVDRVRDFGNRYRAVEVQWPLQRLEYSRRLISLTKNIILKATPESITGK